MEATLSRSDYGHRFRRALIRLQPSMNAVTAAANAVDAYPDSQEVVPEDAAEDWVNECGPDNYRPE